MKIERNRALALRSAWRWGILGTLTVVTLVGWTCRWQLAEVQNHNEMGSAILMVNRWTGEMRWVQRGAAVQVEQIR